MKRRVVEVIGIVQELFGGFPSEKLDGRFRCNLQHVDTVATPEGTPAAFLKHVAKAGSDT